MLVAAFSVNAALCLIDCVIAIIHQGLQLSIYLEDNTTASSTRSEEHTSELQSHSDLVCRLLLEKKKKKRT